MRLPCARLVVEVREAQAEAHSLYGGSGGVGKEHERVEVLVVSRRCAYGSTSESSQGEARLSVRPAAVRLPWSVKVSGSKYQRRGVY